MIRLARAAVFGPGDSGSRITAPASISATRDACWAIRASSSGTRASCTTDGGTGRADRTEDHPDEDRGAGEAGGGQCMADPRVHLAPGGGERRLVFGSGESVQHHVQADDDSPEGTEQERGGEGGTRPGNAPTACGVRVRGRRAGRAWDAVASQPRRR